MAQTARHREAIVQTAARLFRKQGFAATGLNQIVEESGAPKGSVYYYFPAGKEAIAVQAVAWAGQRAVATLAELAKEGAGPAELLHRYVRLLGGWMAASEFREGCPIATTLLETAPQSAAIRTAGLSAFKDWARVFADSLQAQNVAQPRAGRLAALAVAAIEGALLQARVSMDQQPLFDAAQEVALAFEAAIREAVPQAAMPVQA